MSFSQAQVKIKKKNSDLVSSSNVKVLEGGAYAKEKGYSTQNKKKSQVFNFCCKLQGEAECVLSFSFIILFLFYFIFYFGDLKKGSK